MPRQVCMHSCIEYIIKWIRWIRMTSTSSHCRMIEKGRMVEKGYFKGSSILISWLKCHKLQRTLLWKKPQTTYDNSKAWIWKISISASENKLPILKNRYLHTLKSYCFNYQIEKLCRNIQWTFCIHWNIGGNSYKYLCA